MSLVDFKERYKNKWAIGKRREQLVFELLKLYLPPQFQIIPTGVGTLSDSYVPHYHSEVTDKYDFTIYRIINDSRRTLKVPVVYLDVTGYYHFNKMPCILSVKIDYARKYNVLYNVWFAYVSDDTGFVKFISAKRVLELLREHKAKRTKLYSDEKNYYAVPSRYWIHLGRFIDKLKAEARVIIEQLKIKGEIVEVES